MLQRVALPVLAGGNIVDDVVVRKASTVTKTRRRRRPRRTTGSFGTEDFMVVVFYPENERRNLLLFGGLLLSFVFLYLPSAVSSCGEGDMIYDIIVERGAIFQFPFHRMIAIVRVYLFIFVLANSFHSSFVFAIVLCACAHSSW